MNTRLAYSIVTLALAALASVPAGAQEKKEKPKRIAVTSEKDAGPDFAIQGEYEGDVPNGKLGAQVIARGDGRFDVVLIAGGLPGADNDGKRKKSGKGAAAADKVTIKGDDFDGEINGGVMTIRVGDKTGTLKHTVRQSPTVGMQPSAGAVVLFDGTPESAKNWEGGKLIEGDLLNNGILSKRKFTDFTLHMEFRLPYMPLSSGQGRANSGLYLHDCYELQILDSFGLKGVNNECGGFYTQFDPDVNMCLPPLTWQTYDVDFTAARFQDGMRVSKAKVTVKHNGVAIHTNRELPKETPGRQKEADGPAGIHLQNHGDPVYFRNVWVVEKK
jgi:3-keto-disaccharide hydrolase